MSPKGWAFLTKVYLFRLVAEEDCSHTWRVLAGRVKESGGVFEGGTNREIEVLPGGRTTACILALEIGFKSCIFIFR